LSATPFAQTPHAEGAPPILANARALLARYDVLFCDVWGVVHDGFRAFPKAEEALTRFRAKGGLVILLTNAPVPPERVTVMLDRVGAKPAARDAIVSSGAIALRHLREKDYRRLYCIGPRDRDAALFAKLTARQTALSEAEAILCTGLDDDEAQSAQIYVPALRQALARNLPFVCANPDLVVDIGGKHYLCAGSVADLYERMGGLVFWAGKPHASAYEAAREEARRLTGGPVDPAKILVAGDSLRTDMAGAQAAGLDALFIASGIHREDVVDRDALSPALLRKLFAPPAPPAVAAMRELAW
jgi:HAD superfamily hydrolase (TIGR01459 family)